MKKKLTKSSRPKSPSKDMMETFGASPWDSIGKILVTSTKQKTDVFESMRPTKQCVDYKISETWAKMQKGDIKVNLRQTCATYEDIPPEICKPRRNRKIKLFSGGPPQWKFVDELWQERVKNNQMHLKNEHKNSKQKAQKQRSEKHRNDHQIIQRMVGPEWFMELSPQQIGAVNQLKYAVYQDLKCNSTANCEDILAYLGLVVRPTKDHIRIALQHSCRDPVEFLLVLYQLMDPKRTSYSLNDRLLLSAVAHLTITSTLRELHVRIPSPPREPEQPKETVKQNRKKKYKSPYLEPLTYRPPPPRFTGVYKNKHKQYPESPYFSYLATFEHEKRFTEFCFLYSMHRQNEEMQLKMKEYKNAQEFYESLPGIREDMLHLIPPSTQRICFNMLNPRKMRPIKIKPKLIAPHLCIVSVSEPMVCFCKENEAKRDDPEKKIKRSCCEKNAQKYLGSICWCDECIEAITRKNLIRIHAGFQKSSCKCDDPVPIIQGTLRNNLCECYKEYRNKIVACAARQRLADQKAKRIIGEVVMTKLGPIYKILGTQGEKICKCSEIIERKSQLKKSKDILLNSEAKFVNGGITMSQFGPIYNLTSVAARKPCKCIFRYWQQLAVLKIQNIIRKSPVCFLNNGLVAGKLGPIFHFGGVPGNVPSKFEEVRSVCSCELEKTACFEHCWNYLQYKVDTHDAESTTSEGSSEDERSDTEEESSGEDREDLCLKCDDKAAVDQQERKQRSCQPASNKPAYDNQLTSSTASCSAESDEDESSDSDSVSSSNQNENEEDYLKPKPCRCKDELERFMKSKCPCEQCNRLIRQSYATYVMGGTTTNTDGDQVNLVQCIRQPLCGCMKDHLENIQKIDEYKGRVKARLDLKKQPKKYCVAGVKNTPDGPVYIISGIRPPVECECARAAKEKEEIEALQKQAAKPLKTGRIKYEISGVKAMEEENIYIVSRALKSSPCQCEKLLQKFEQVHKDCMQELENYLIQTEAETKAMEDENKEKRSVDMTFKNAFENIEANVIETTDDDKAIVDTPILGEDDNKDVIAQTDCNNDFGNDETSSEESDSSSSDSSDESSECGSCHVDNSLGVTPISIPLDKTLPEQFVSKRFAIFRRMPTNKKVLMKILKHILEGMAEDGFPLAKLPQVYKLPIFKLWIELRIGVYWSYEDKLVYHGFSKYLWRHTDVCYKNPTATTMPYTIKEARQMTWKHAKVIRKVAAQKRDKFYRNLKQITVDTGREFFATTFPYEFPTCTWRDCAFAYIPTKEENLFPYKIVKPHDCRTIPDNKKVNCYC